MATPHVVGVAALLMSAKPNATAGQVREALISTAHNPNDAPDDRWGQGLVQPKAALAAL